MKTNFRKNDDKQSSSTKNENTSNQKDLTQKEFEEFISKSGAKGSFMVYRSTKKDEELGLDEL
ncbi:hypothetical protein OAP90_03910 [Nitrosopumilus sp.]|jgi:hypothetical protein|nr:hypothetical protein [Nitrosopumilus sp.]|tara:strand:+ start:119 stop:307 length:189 start_codon:yes stop_codon:yes gene_type:complete